MELVMQSTSETCGQACIAMITGKDIEEVMKDMKITRIGRCYMTADTMTLNLD